MGSLFEVQPKFATELLFLETEIAWHKLVSILATLNSEIVFGCEFLESVQPNLDSPKAAKAALPVYEYYSVFEYKTTKLALKL